MNPDPDAMRITVDDASLRRARNRIRVLGTAPLAIAVAGLVAVVWLFLVSWVAALVVTVPFLVFLAGALYVAVTLLRDLRPAHSYLIEIGRDGVAVGREPDGPALVGWDRIAAVEIAGRGRDAALVLRFAPSAPPVAPPGPPATGTPRARPPAPTTPPARPPIWTTPPARPPASSTPPARPPASSTPPARPPASTAPPGTTAARAGAIPRQPPARPLAVRFVDMDANPAQVLGAMRHHAAGRVAIPAAVPADREAAPPGRSRPDYPRHSGLG
ncbi:hypothetical protein GCM10023322_59610 [Rugosimonospora acidiphila]|uniref:Uncharacterized protein n=1 Tax=Rugosimonospora acidiphila TaxID=556531 RepID=A0ABP9SDV6_9ACTN